MESGSMLVNGNVLKIADGKVIEGSPQRLSDAKTTLRNSLSSSSPIDGNIQFLEEYIRLSSAEVPEGKKVPDTHTTPKKSTQYRIVNGKLYPV